MKVSLFKTVVNRDDIENPAIVDIDKVLEGIRSGGAKGKWKELVEAVQASTSKEEYDKRKKQLPAVLFAGEFSARRSDAFIRPSGFISIDLDKMDADMLASTRQSLVDNEYVYACFISPSKKGLKALVRANFNSYDEYKSVFCAVDDMFGKSQYFDLHCSDISRACFISYDPQIYINPSAKLFEGFVDDVELYMKERRLLDPEATFKFLIKWMDSNGFNYKYGVEGSGRNSYLYVLSAAMCRYGVIKEETLGFFYKKFNDLTKDELDQVVGSAYKRNAFGSVQITAHKPDKDKEFYKKLEVPEFEFDPELVVDDPKDTNDMVFQIANGVKRSFTTGLKAMDKYMPWKENEYYAVVAGSKTGKTQTYSYLMMMAAKYSAWRFMVITTETSIAEYKYTMVQFYLNKPIKDIRGCKVVPDADIAEALLWIDQYFIFLKNDIDHLNVLDTYHYMTTKNVYVNAIIIDPISNIKKSKKLSHKNGNDYSEELNVEYLNFSKKHCSIIAINHTISSKERERTAPYVQDGEYGAQIARRCHVGISLFREMYDELRKNVVQMHVRLMRTKNTTGGDNTSDNSPIELEFKLSPTEFGYNITVDGFKWLSPLHRDNVREYVSLTGSVDTSRIEKEDDKPF
jgi:hypothetical protein